MDLKKSCSKLLVGVVACMSVVAMMSAVNSPVIDVAYADGLEDDIGSTASYSDDAFGDIANQPIEPGDQGVIDWMKGHRNVTDDQLRSASRTLTPVTAAIGYVTGGIMVLIMAGVTFITALDLLYIAIPPVRGLLYSGGAGAGSAGMMGRGMMGRGMMGRGMMGGMSGSGGAQGGQKQWVSDEAIACAGLLGAGGQAQSTGGMGMYGMGGMQGGQAQQSTGSVIGTYFKKRLFFIIILAICLIVLTSSVVMDCGINLAEWILKMFGVINNKL